MYLRFVYHDRRQLAGQSDPITLSLTDLGNVSLDDELNVLPGMTVVDDGKVIEESYEFIEEP